MFQQAVEVQKLTPKEAFAKAEKLYQNKSYEQAYEYYKRASSRYPESYFKIATLYFNSHKVPVDASRLSQLSQCLEYIEKLVSRKDNKSKTLFKNAENLLKKIHEELKLARGDASNKLIAQQYYCRFKIHDTNGTEFKRFSALISASKHNYKDSRDILILELKKVSADKSTQDNSNKSALFEWTKMALVYIQFNEIMSQADSTEKQRFWGLDLGVILYKKTGLSSKLYHEKIQMGFYEVTNKIVILNEEKKQLERYNKEELGDKITREYNKILDNTQLGQRKLQKILKWFIKVASYSAQVNAAIKNSLTDSPRDIESAKSWCLYAKYLNLKCNKNNDDISNILSYLESACMAKHVINHKKFTKYFSWLEKFYSAHGFDSGLASFEKYKLEHGNKSHLVDKAKNILQEYDKAKNIDQFKQAVKLLRKAALSYNEDALQLLKDRAKPAYEFLDINKPDKVSHYDEVAPEIIYALWKVFSLVGTYKPTGSSRVDRSPFLYHNKNYEKELHSKARFSYGQALRHDRPGIYYDLGKLYYKGELFKRNYFVARDFFETSKEKIKNNKGLIYLARMYFSGEGGEVDFLQAGRLINAQSSETLKAADLYLKGKINLQLYLKDKQKNNQSLAVDSFYLASLQAHKESILLLFILWRYYDFSDAYLKIKLIYKNYHENMSLNKIINSIGFPNFPDDKHYYYHEIIFLGVEDKKCNNNEASLLKEYEEYKLTTKQRIRDHIVELEEDLKKLHECKAIDSKYSDSQPLNENASSINKIKKILNNYSKKGFPTALKVLAEYELQHCQNSLLMRRLAERYSQYYDDAKRHLLTHYSAKGYKGILNLISSLNYELYKHTIKSSVCQLLIDLLKELDVENSETYSLLSKSELQKKLSERLNEKEKETGCYYDEFPVDDLDYEEEHNYQVSSHHVTADRIIREELSFKIINQTTKSASALLKLKHINDEQYKKNIDNYGSLFSEVMHFNPKKLSKFEKRKDIKWDNIKSDLRTVNFFQSSGKLAEGLKLVTTDFVVAQTRGLHFNLKSWSASQRQRFCQLAHQDNHPLLRRPIYSMAVYKHAKVDDFSDLSELTQLRLEISAYFIYNKMVEKMNTLPAYTEDTLPKSKAWAACIPIGNSISSFNAQMQQFYTCKYDQYHQLLSDQDDVCRQMFVNGANHLVSTGDIQSSHSYRYSYGDKYYQGQESERLRPHWTHLKASYPYSGALILSFHPLDDFTNNDYNRVIPMNFASEMIIPEVILSERECSFFSYIKPNRVEYVHIAKYPSFHHRDYLKIMLYEYGLNKDLYHLFKQLFQQSKPHSNKRRLTKALLGKHICAYQTRYFMQFAYNRALSKNKILIYPDKFGCFRLEPTCDISPTPNGSQDCHFAQRFFTLQTRKKQAMPGRAYRSPESKAQYLSKYRVDGSNKRRKLFLKETLKDMDISSNESNEGKPVTSSTSNRKMQ